MRISTNWIKDYVDLENENLNDLALKITKAGVNIESVITNKITNLVIGKVESVTKHPDSDHLNVCMVNVGDSVLQIVCGADNVSAGIKVIVALSGAILPGNFEIKKGIIRGVESNGMICALYELGLENKEENYHKGIHILNEDAPIGLDPIKYLELDDTVYELDLNPNRNDCLSHIGFAYEVAAVLNKKVVMPNLDVNVITDSVNNHLNLEIDTDNCYMYLAKMVKDVVIKESPNFIKQRLVNAGMRPINNVVDISNYIMLEYGQPLHFFDKDKLGNNILVRMAKDNEEVITLDSKTRVLTEKDIVITNGESVVAIAGVMGCANSNADETTKNILIESAIFNPFNVRYTSINLDLRSEASIRYEKGLNHEYASLAIARACSLLEKYATGKVLSDTVVFDKVDKKVRTATVTKAKINSMLGMDLNDSDIANSFNALGFDYKLNGDTYEVIIPNRRIDVERNSADLIEEVGRLYGYDNIKSKLPVGEVKQGKYVGNVRYRKLISNRLRALGLNEVRTYTLVGETEDKLFDHNKCKSISLLKPMSADKAIIRQSILPGLLKVIDYNNARNIKDIMIYEISNVYYNEFAEDTKIAIALKGDYLTNKWQGVSVKTDFYILKGMIENILDYLGLKNRYSFETKIVNDIHPGMSAVILLDREEVGFIGKVHPSIRKDDIYVAELSMNKLVSKTVKPIKHKESSKYPEVNRDVAFVIDMNISASEVITTIKKAGGRLLTSVDVFDVYIGDKLEKDKKSIAFSLVFSDPTKTLGDEEITESFNRIISEVQTKMNAKLRS